MAGATGRGRELTVRFEEANPDCLVQTDPNIVGPLIALMVAYVEAAGADSMTVRTSCTPGLATFVVEPAVATDSSLPAIVIRALPSVPPSKRAAQSVAKRMDIVLNLSPQRGSISLPSTSG